MFFSPHPYSKTIRFQVAIALVFIGAIFTSLNVTACAWLASWPGFNNKGLWITAAAVALILIGYFICPKPKPRPLSLITDTLMWLTVVAPLAPLSYSITITIQNYLIRTLPLVIVGVIAVLRRMSSERL